MYMGEVAPTNKDLFSALLQSYVPQYSKEIAVLTGTKPVAVQTTAAKAAAAKAAATKPAMTVGTKIAIGGGLLGAVGLIAMAFRGRGRSR